MRAEMGPAGAADQRSISIPSESASFPFTSRLAPTVTSSARLAVADGVAIAFHKQLFRFVFQRERSSARDRYRTVEHRRAAGAAIRRKSTGMGRGAPTRGGPRRAGWCVPARHGGRAYGAIADPSVPPARSASARPPNSAFVQRILSARGLPRQPVSPGRESSECRRVAHGLICSRPDLPARLHRDAPETCGGAGRVPSRSANNRVGRVPADLQLLEEKAESSEP